MQILLSTAEAWIIFGCTSLGVILLLFIIFYFTCGFRFKRKKMEEASRVVVDEAFISKLLHGLGGFDNIKQVSLDNGRVKFYVSDLDLLIADELKELSSSGVFITGNNVKLLFKYDSQTIVNSLYDRGVEKC